MILEIQIQSLIVSFVYGMFISLLYNQFYFLLYNDKKILLIISDLFFCISLSLLYFFIMYKINYANIHPYFIGMLLIGFLIGNRKTKIIRRKVKIRGRE